jgi:hypothetical protein
MRETDKAASPDLTPWLQEVARRPWPASGQVTATAGIRGPSSEQLLAYLESLAGRSLRTREAIDAFMSDAAAQRTDAWRARVRRSIARQTAVLGTLTAAFLTFYFLDVNLQIQSLQKSTFLVPHVQPLAHGKRTLG